MTLAASTSIAARELAGATSLGFGSVCSLGSQVEISSLAREKLGCRERVVKASAQESVKDGVADEREVAGPLREGFVLRDWQQPPSAPLPPQQPEEATLAERDAASVLQKRVLRGSARH